MLASYLHLIPVFDCDLFRNAATKCNAYNQQPMEICGETLSLSEGTALSDLSSFHTGTVFITLQKQFIFMCYTGV